MSRKFNLLMCMFIIFLLFTSCSQDTKANAKMTDKPSQSDNRGDGNSNASKFSIYLVKETDYSKIDTVSIDKLALEKEPLITEKDIEYYDWNTENQGLDTPLIGQLVSSKSSFKLKDGTSLEDKLKSQGYKGAKVFNFVVTVGKERIYLGSFYSAATSMSPPSKINVFSPMNLTSTQTIELLDTSNKDVVHDKRIYYALENSKLLKQ